MHARLDFGWDVNASIALSFIVFAMVSCHYMTSTSYNTMAGIRRGSTSPCFRTAQIESWTNLIGPFKAMKWYHRKVIKVWSMRQPLQP